MSFRSQARWRSSSSSSRGIAALSWFDRDKTGFDSPALDESLLGFLSLLLIPLSVLLIAFAMRGFRQQWNIEAGSRAAMEGPKPSQPDSLRLVAAQELVDKAIEAHGGLPYFQSLTEVGLRLRAGGLAFAMRFQHPGSIHARVTTTELRTVFFDYPEEGKRGVFEPGAVRIESNDGELVAQRDDPRAAFGNLRHKIWWDALDLLHFGGYALWNYVAAPFVFKRPGFELTEIDPWMEQGERWDRLRVSFPRDIPTHSREQDYYFDERGLLRRLDYTAEVFGGWAKATHYCLDHGPFDGLMVPTRRKVFPRKRTTTRAGGPDARDLARDPGLALDLSVNEDPAAEADPPIDGGRARDRDPDTAVARRDRSAQRHSRGSRSRR